MGEGVLGGAGFALGGAGAGGLLGVAAVGFDFLGLGIGILPSWKWIQKGTRAWRPGCYREELYY